MYTLPAPRYTYYESSDFYKIKQRVLDETDKVINSLGFYPVQSCSSLLLLL